MSGPLLYLVAGEPSGDALGAGLMHELKSLRPDLRFAGIGGELMAEEGLASAFPYRELSVMGFVEILPRLVRLLRRLRETGLDIARLKPDAVITIDSPGFNFRLARALKDCAATASIPRIHYVAPSVWAYRPRRARTTAELFQLLLTLLPLEPPYFEREGLATRHVGHPALWVKPSGSAVAFRARHRLPPDAPILLLLPGSRAGEVRHHLPIFLKAARALPDFIPIVLAGAVGEPIQADSEGTLVVDSAEKEDVFAAATLALTKSGTVTLELAVAGVPMIVAHKMNPISAFIIRRMTSLRYVSLVNIAAGKEIVPELLQEKCTPSRIAAALAELARPEAQMRQRRECERALEALRGPLVHRPSRAAAEAILSWLAERKAAGLE